MIWYLAQRLLLAVIIGLVSLTLLFSLVYVIPGDPASVALGPRATEEMRMLLRERMGLDQPLLVQLGRFIGNVATGNLGVDVWSGRSVTEIVLEVLPNTVTLAVVGLGWAIALGIPIGVWSALRRGSLADGVVGVITVAAISIPPFLVAIYSVLLFAVHLRWLPAIGAGEAGDPTDQLRHLILPAFALGLGWVGYLARIVRASMLEVLQENHIRTAHAFGLPPGLIVYRYALRLAVLPTVTLLGVAFGSLMSGAVFVELVFNRPGIGLLVYNAAMARNYPVVMGAVLVTVFLFTICTLISDIVIAALDPRVRAEL